MKIASFSQSKYKHSAKPGDDVALVIPDQVFAVFDGATDPTGAVYDGQSSGRFAARIAARTVAQLTLSGELRELPAMAIFQHISDAVKTEALRMNASHPPSTTAAIVLDTGNSYRVLLAGDSGVRINGDKVLQQHKLIDTVSTSARIAVFKQLSSTNDDADAVEAQTRSIIFSGLTKAIADGILSTADAERIVFHAAEASGLQNDIGPVDEFLMGGIRVQFHFANRQGHIMGYSSLNGGQVIADGTLDLTYAKPDVKSIELFTDGYLTLPAGIDVSDWEAEFARVETADFHKTGLHPAVKGSTSQEYCDDRTVLCLSGLL